MGAIILGDAMSGVSNIVSAAPKLLMSQFLNGTIAYPSPPTKGSGTRFYYSDPTGLDSLGFGAASITSALNSAGLIRREILLVAGDPSVSPFYGDVVTDTWADIAAVFTTQIVANDLPGGRGNKVVITQLKRSTPEWKNSYPQIWNAVFYRSTWTNPLPPICLRFKMKLPANMIDVLADNPSYQGWSEQLAMKSHVDNAVTDSRLSMGTIRFPGDSQLKFRINFDLFGKNLSGVDITPAGAPLHLWYLESALGAANPGDVYDIYVYFKPPVNKDDLITGECRALIVNLTQNTIALSGKVIGGPMMGYYSYPIGRIYTQGIYTGGFPSSGNIQFEYGDLQFWSCMPVY